MNSNRLIRHERASHSVQSRQAASKEAAAAGGAGLRAFTRIAELWHLSISEQLALLGITSRSTYFKWRKEPQPKLPRDTLERLSYLLGIYKALQLLLPDTHAAMSGSVAGTTRSYSVEGPRSSECSRAMWRIFFSCGNTSTRSAAKPGSLSDSLIMATPYPALAVNEVRWQPCFRVISSRFPPIHLFEPRLGGGGLGSALLARIADESPSTRRGR